MDTSELEFMPAANNNEGHQDQTLTDQKPSDDLPEELDPAMQLIHKAEKDPELQAAIDAALHGPDITPPGLIESICEATGTTRLTDEEAPTANNILDFKKKKPKKE